MHPTLFKVKNALSVASAPMECLISLLYWGLRAVRQMSESSTTSHSDADETSKVDPRLVLPDWAPPLPFHTDMSFHAIPSITLVIDLLFFSPPYTIAFLPALALSGCIAFGYWFWIERCYQVNKFYPYPIFGMLDTTQRIGCVSAWLCATASAVLTNLQIVCHVCISHDPVDQHIDMAVQRRERQGHR